MTAQPRAASYFFIAARAQGRRTLGVRQARDRRALSDVLRRERLLLLRSYRLPAWAVRERALPAKDVAILNDALAQLLGRGVPLVEALEVAAATVSTATRPLVERLRELVAAGSLFADACQKTGAFDRVTVAVYRAAERSGDLAGAARQLAVTVRRQLDVSSKAATAMIYPSIVLSISLLVVLGMLTFLVPRLGAAITDLAQGGEGALPWYTRAIMGAGSFLRSNLVILGAVLAGVAVLGVLARRPMAGLLAVLARRAPLLREVVLARESARFFSVMAAMAKSGVPLADALGVANAAVGMPRLRRQLETLRHRLIEGGSLRVLIEQVDALPLATRRLLIAAERTGDMETAFDGLAADMAGEVERRAQRLLATLEPVLIVGLFLVIGVLLLAMYLPMITMSGQVQ